jgi:hypothetical protein
MIDDTFRRSPTGPPAVVTGMMFFRPVAGVVVQVVHYLQALRALGFDPIYLERTGWWFLDPRSGVVSPDPTAAISAARSTLDPLGYGDRWALRVEADGDETCHGLDAASLGEWCRPESVLLNVTGTQFLSHEMLDCGTLLYVESDPFVAQFDVAMGDDQIRRHLDAHHHLFTFGETINGPAFPLPLHPYRWHPTRQAVDLELWRTDGPPATDRFTTVTSWHNAEKDRVWNGVTYYWTKGREFERFLDVGLRHPARFEMAVPEPGERRDLLARNGWSVVDAQHLSADFSTYRSYIRDSMAEITVARDQYVRPRTGWFSDRGACYLAAGRPVICQETGFSEVLPTGKGLHPFSTADELDAAVDDILADPSGNAEAARAIAEGYFDGAELVRRMLETDPG